jgi:DNA-binding NarL/FixJ family response regulator
MLRVLILDDDALFGRAVRSSLNQSELACEVAAVTTEAEAYAKVQQVETPFDVFLIDQRLGPGPDGITVLEELLRLSPDSETIVFTRVGDVEVSMRAYRAGAYRCLHKPVHPQELVLILHSLREWRDARQERDGLMVLTVIAERAQSALTLPDLGAVMTWGGCRFGFERARLWLLEEDGTMLIGLSQKGNPGLEEIADIRFAVAESPYVSRAITQREPSIFHGEEHGPSYLHRHIAEFQRPEGEWVILPLWLRNHCLGMLVLDNHSKPQRIRAQQRQELALLGQQVAAALERVQLYAQEQRKNRELDRAAGLESRGDRRPGHAAAGCPHASRPADGCEHLRGGLAQRTDRSQRITPGYRQ